jgi:16S rRNA (cytidine1402-2'-O)-methyltransferase
MGGSRHVVVAREVTKLHEEFLRGRADEVLEQLRERGEVKGEITLLIARDEETGERKGAPGTEARIGERLQQLMADHKLDEKAALKLVAKELGVSRSEAYRELQRAKR